MEVSGYKRNREQYKRLIKFSAAAVIITLELAIYWNIWMNFYNPMIARPYWRKGNWLMAAVYCILLLFFNQMYGGLKVGFLRRGNLIYSQILSVTFVNIITYFQISLIDMRLHHPMLILLIEVLDVLVIVAWVFVFQKIYERLFPPRKMILIYGDRATFHLMDKINSRDDKYVLTGAIHINQGMDEILKAIKQYDAVVVGDIPSHTRNQIIKICYGMNIRTYAVPKISDILVRSAIELNIFDSPLYLSRNDGLSVDQEIVKRVEDILFSIFGLIISSPFFLVIAALIKINDGGPVFYKQSRLTKNGKIFQIYKFRTMVMNAEKLTGPKLASEHDPRITKVGRFLRACRMDELPQLINILKGDMSVVGPRPERPELAAIIEKNIPEFPYRLKVKAGLTGYAQFYGKYNTTAYDKLKLDLTYIRNYSFFLDLKLILLTPKILLMKESTEGVAEDEFTDPALIDPDDKTSDIKEYGAYMREAQQ